MTLLHRHPLSLNGTDGMTGMGLEHEHERGDEKHTHSVTPDGQSYTSTEFDADLHHVEEDDGTVVTIGRNRSELLDTDPVRAALLVITETPATRDWLAEHDPMALRQAQGALLRTEAKPPLPRSDNPRYATIKRRFPVMLEDCIVAPVPDDVDASDPEELMIWARENSDRLWQEANLRRQATDVGDAAEMDRLADLDYAQFRWEDEHHADIESIDDEYDVELEQL